MTDDERFSLLVGLTGASDLWPVRDERIPQGVPMCAGYVPGIPRLGVPALLMSDAGLGVTNPGYRPGDTATALPAGLALAASFNPVLARSSGKAIGREARSRGFNVQLAGAINLARDPRNGRNFEYLSEDPLLSATMAAESIIGIQQQGVIATTKHFSLNCNETNRHWLDAVIDPDAHRESDLLAFEIVIERSQPGAVMAAYNKVNGNLYLLPSSPLSELRKRLPNAQFEFDPGINPAEAVLAARRADIAIVFAIRAEGEGFDSADLSLPWGQDALIAAVASANANTVVVLETGNPVTMPWRDSVNAIMQAWYPGQAGGQAVAEIVTGQVNPSGRLPITFPVDLGQTPRSQPPELGAPWGTSTTIHYTEGADVGYRWFASTNQTPMFAFGHGLSYTSFEYRDLVVTGGHTVHASFSVTNTGDRSGADVPQLYMIAAPGESRLRLLGFERVELEPGQTRRVRIEADPRLLARYDGEARSWRIEPGGYTVAVGASAVALKLAAKVKLAGRGFGR